MLASFAAFAGSAVPLPTSPGAAAAQAAHAACRALAHGQGAVRLQICLHGEAIEDSNPLPLLSLCTRLAEEMDNVAKIHFFFNDGAYAAAWEKSPAAKNLGCRSDALDCEDAFFDAIVSNISDDALLVLVAPCNLPSARTAAPDLPKLQRVQQLVTRAARLERPVILANPELEALLLTRRVGKGGAAPMFLSDFEHAFFMAEAEAKVGYVTAVRRVWGQAWEVYRVVDGEASSAEHEARSTRWRVAGSGGGGSSGTIAALERTVLACKYDVKPRAATLLEAHVRKRRAAGRGGAPSREVPGRPAHEVPWSAEDGWAWNGVVEWDV